MWSVYLKDHSQIKRDNVLKLFLKLYKAQGEKTKLQIKDIFPVKDIWMNSGHPWTIGNSVYRSVWMRAGIPRSPCRPSSPPKRISIAFLSFVNVSLTLPSTLHLTTTRDNLCAVLDVNIFMINLKSLHTTLKYDTFLRFSIWLRSSC